MVKVGVEDNEVRDGFGRDIELVELVQERIGNRADPAFDDGIGLPSNEIKVKEFASEKSDAIGYVEWELHMISLTHCF
ncbi:MAG: hypothetical protein Q7V12_02430 [Deltaproteobacteria bacterium]|nr:hypothetical protein [Deltaproteobacteria bacterium]